MKTFLDRFARKTSIQNPIYAGMELMVMVLG